MTQTVVTGESAVAEPERAVRSLLQRVIMPRSGDPLAVRSLYVDEHTNIQLSTVPPAPGSAPAPTVRLTGTARRPQHLCPGPPSWTRTWRRRYGQLCRRPSLPR